MPHPNIIIVFWDQWRRQALGYAGDPNARTPRIDALARESVNFTQAVGGCPVCSPFRASLMTGQYPLTHGVFVNDVRLQHRATTLADAFGGAGYETAYIGKWHLDAHGRSAYIPPERRLGFAEYWKVLECTHDYNHSAYYAGDSDEKRFWDGYDAFAQTEDACRWIRERGSGDTMRLPSQSSGTSVSCPRPFLMVLSWGPPHEPYDNAPNEFRAMYDPASLTLRPNVPEATAPKAREWLAGYYAHCTALDACVGRLLDTLRDEGIEKDTIFLFMSDHGDMLGSHGDEKKQRPWDESVRIPFLLRWPGMPDWTPRELTAPMDAPDIMPTLLGLCGLPIPDTCEGLDYSGHIRGGPDPSDGSALLMCPHPFGQWTKSQHGGREYRGLRTRRHTYIRALDGPWLLYDNEADPYQMRNLIGDPAHAALQRDLDERLRARLSRMGDAFLPGMDYIRRWGYTVSANGTVPYTL